ncbi:glycine zipper 2TM domain-containing protein [Sphingorhabdus soli]|uniref:17 kDa surface antigen n=1 Tax=Flavisphingopyxis soli TaxID=2601267 RepID=A0A5C6UL06_9SPHN|nr:glycine zipper 2TM domain-containing protein [Sphingorhabdus soli]TXC73862.1 glycine zipper 2TM domain-containing protein [Sphingorhabdus soli]
MKTLILSLAAFGLVAPTAALADPPSWSQSNSYHKGKKHKHRYRSSANQRGYYTQGQAQPLRANTRVWQGDDGRYYCKRDNGTTGLIVGGVVGGLIGNEVAGRGDRTLGTILGAAGGALLGREIDRRSGRNRYSCR